MREQLQQLRSPIIIGVAGDSGSGKTTYSNGIRMLLGQDLVKTICLDGYHKEDREARKKSGRLPLDPDANNLDLLQAHLRDLKQGQSIHVPIYNHGTGKFDPPELFEPSPIIIVEGLHSLYPELLPWLDFTIFVDPDHAVKWEWKWERDIKRRGHKAEALEQEMVAREAAYKRWLDFQKINATIVIKIAHSQLHRFAHHQFTGILPAQCYQVELIWQPASNPLGKLILPFNLATMMETDQPPFLLSAIPYRYWGKNSVGIRLDGVLAPETVEALESYIVNLTGIPIDVAIPKEEYEQISATRFTQLLVAWRFLEQVQNILR